MGNKIRAETNSTARIFIKSVAVANGLIEIVVRKCIKVTVVFCERATMTTHIIAENPVS